MVGGGTGRPGGQDQRDGEVDGGRDSQRLRRGVRPASPQCLCATTWLPTRPESMLSAPCHVQTPCLGYQIALGPIPHEKNHSDDGGLCIRLR